MQIRKFPTLGWDVGGAHLKAALVDTSGVALKVIQVACPLWRGLDQLERAISEVLAVLGSLPEQHAVTMTGELADIFPDRRSGVARIANAMQASLKGEVRFYAGRHGFVAGNEVSRHALDTASANWLVSAEYVASRFNEGLFIDFGSTTTDFVLLSGGKPRMRGYTDAERLQVEELVYTGMIRTPLMALAEKVPFGGEWCSTAAEYFATAADSYRLTGELAAEDDMSETADGAGKSREDSARRLARMIGRDLDDAPISAWIGLARAYQQKQLELLRNAALRHLSRNLVDAQAPLIGAGAGGMVIRQLAVQLNRGFHDVAEIIPARSEQEKKWAAICLPAYAVACLAAGQSC